MRIFRKTSNFAKNCQNQGGHNLLKSGPVLKQKTLIVLYEKSKKFLLLLFSIKIEVLCEISLQTCWILAQEST